MYNVKRLSTSLYYFEPYVDSPLRHPLCYTRKHTRLIAYNHKLIWPVILVIKTVGKYNVIAFNKRSSDTDIANKLLGAVLVEYHMKQDSI